MERLKEVVHLDLLYSAWATRQLLKACEQLSIADRSRDLGGSHANVMGTLYHFHISERFWAQCLATNKIPPLHEIGAEAVPTEIQFEELAEGCERVAHAFEEWFASTTEEELAQPLSCQISATVDFPYVRWQLIRHVVNHSSIHRCQVVGMIRALGSKPPNIDVMTYLLKSYL